MSKPEPRFLPVVVGKVAGDWLPLMLPLALSLRLREVGRESGGSRAWLGLRMDLESFIEDEKKIKD